MVPRWPRLTAFFLGVAIVISPAQAPNGTLSGMAARVSHSPDSRLAVTRADHADNSPVAANSPDAGISQQVRYQYSAEAGSAYSGFHFRSSGDGYRAESGSLVTHVTRDGVRYQLQGTEFAVSTRSVGRDVEVPVIPASDLRRSDNRVELDRGPLTEWIVNGPLGAQQAWTVNDRPVGDGPLVLRLAVAGGDVAIESPNDARFISRAGATLPFGGLLAFDATERQLQASFVASEGGLAIRVQDAAAVYPIVIDPFAEVGFLFAGDFADENAGFGASVAVSGDGSTVAIGAPFGGLVQDPQVFVFHRPVDGWQGFRVPSARLKSVPSLGLGSVLAMNLDGTVIATSAKNGNQTIQVYQRPGPTWTGVLTQVANLTTASASLVGSEGFGLSLAISDAGDIISVGDGRAMGANPQEGAVFVFNRGGASWTNRATHDARLYSTAVTFGGPPPTFGSAVVMAPDGSAIIVGARNDTCNQLCGKVFSFSRPGGGWTGDIVQVGTLTAEPGFRVPGLGTSLALSADGKTLVAGGSFGTSSPADPVAVFTTTTSFITSTQAALLRNPTSSPRGFGSSVAISGDGRQILVAGREPRPVHVFERPDTGWQGNIFAVDQIVASLPSFTFQPAGIPLALSRDGSTVVLGFPPGGDFGSGEARVFVQPSFTGFSPSSGSPGDTITITGTNLYAASNIKFGNTNAHAFRLSSATQMTATVGTGATGDVVMQVGPSEIRLPGFTFKKGPSTVSLGTPVPQGSVPNQPVAFNFAVTTTLGTPAGVVSVTASTGEVCTAPATAGSCQITFYTVGSRSVQAMYLGTSAFSASVSSPIDYLARIQTSTLIQSVSSTMPRAGTPVTVTYGVSSFGQFGALGGTVTVTASTGESCVGTVTTGFCLLTFTSDGPHLVTATFAGSSEYGPSTSQSVAIGVLPRFFIYFTARKGLDLP